MRKILPIAVALLLLGAYLYFWLRDRPFADAYQAATGGPVPVRISRTEIGVVPRPGVSESDVIARLSQQGFRQRGSSLGGVIVLALPETRSRLELWRAIRAIEAREGALIGIVGMVVRKKGEDTPIVAANEVIVRLRPGRTLGDLQALNTRVQATVAMQNPFAPNQYLLRLLAASQVDPFAASRAYVDSGVAEFAFPNFTSPTASQQDGSLLPSQWPHLNTGQGKGTIDADGDTAEAWNITRGSSNVVIAILELGGFDLTHPDLAPNLWTNPGETPGNGLDDDGNGFADDRYGWDFRPCIAAAPGCGDADLQDSTDAHGTAVAGIAVASGRITGICPQCRAMLVRVGLTDWAQSLGVGYAATMRADVINMSFDTFTAPATALAIESAATTGRGNLGSVVVVAAGNRQVNVCNVMEFAKSPFTIAVSSSSNQDRKVVIAAKGPCVDVLAPSHRGYDHRDPYTGTLNVPTLDIAGEGGYNQENPVAYCPSKELTDRGYTMCFGGTSAASPFVAGMAGLILSVRPALTRDQVQRLIQDTTDKVEPSEGDYSEVNGRSKTLPDETHAFGRVNVFEAVRVAAPAPSKNGVDVFLRDNHLDWGNTEQPSSTRFDPVRGTIPNDSSLDIRVRRDASSDIPSSLEFEAFASQKLKRSSLNNVLVRVRNRGPVAASTVRVDLYMAAMSSSTAPALPSAFWTSGPPATSTWKLVGTQTIATVPYSGSSQAGTIVVFSLTPPSGASRVMLLAIVDTAGDRPGPRTRTPTTDDFNVAKLVAGDNNVSARVVQVTNALGL